MSYQMSEREMCAIFSLLAGGAEQQIIMNILSTLEYGAKNNIRQWVCHINHLEK